MLITLWLGVHAPYLAYAAVGNQVLIIVGETGSGKTTQLPQYAPLTAPLLSNGAPHRPFIEQWRVKARRCVLDRRYMYAGAA